jgi:ABC-2 type transport system permease protein
MSVGQAQKQRGTNYREVESPGGITKLLTLTGQDVSLRARGVLIWGVVLGALGAMFVAIAPSLTDNPGMEELINSMPQAMLDLFGYGAGGFGSVEGILDGEMLGFMVPLALSIFAILVASSALAGAEEEGTMDVLMGNPLPRWQLVVSRFLSAAVLLLGIVAIMGLITWLTALVLDVDLAFESMFFGGLAMLCSAIFHRRFLAIAIPLALLVVMYFVDGLASSVEFLEDIQPLSAFYYYGSAIQDGIDWANFAGLTAATLVLIGIAVLIFRRRDIYT